MTMNAMTTETCTVMKTLWEKILGPAPVNERFALWEELYTPEVIRWGIIRTARKNLEDMNGQMSSADKVKFADMFMAAQTVRLQRRNENKVLGPTLLGATLNGRREL